MSPVRETPVPTVTPPITSLTVTAVNAQQTAEGAPALISAALASTDIISETETAPDVPTAAPSATTPRPA